MTMFSIFKILFDDADRASISRYLSIAWIKLALEVFLR